MRSELDTASFEELVQVRSQELNLAAAALAFAEGVYPGLDRGAYLRRLDEMAKEAGKGLGPQARAVEILSRLNAYLFEEQGFSGNREHYSDPRNSYLNEVMDRRLGIPISLSVLYLELGWRLGLACDGVGFPGHFLVKCTVHGGEAVLDPFNAGASLGEDDLLRMAARATGRERIERGALRTLVAACDRRAILSRMLRNLKFIHLQEGEHEHALRVVNAMLSLDPGSDPDLLDRARIHDAMHAMRAALADFRAYLQRVPGSAERGPIQARIDELQARVRRLN